MYGLWIFRFSIGTLMLMIGQISIVQTFPETTVPKTVIGEDSDFKNATSSNPIFCTTKACNATAKQVLAAMNQSVDPCDDFYEYACGEWIANHPIPDNESSISNWWIVEEKAKIIEQNMIQAPVKDVHFSAEAKLKSLYTQCMKKEEREELRAKPVIKLLDSILGGWPLLTPNWDPDQFDLFRVLTMLANARISGFFSIFVGASAEHPSENLIFLSGVSGPISKDVHLSSSGPLFREGFSTYLKTITSLIMRDANDARNISTVTNDLDEITALQRELAMAGLTRIQQRDSLRRKNYVTLGDMIRKYQFQSDMLKNLTNLTRELFQPAGMDYLINDSTITVVPNEEFFPKLDQILAKLEANKSDGKRIIANYLGWNIISAYSGRLAKDYRDASEVYTQRVSGLKKVRDTPFPEMCTGAASGKMSLAYSSVYIRDLISTTLKRTILVIIDDIAEAMKDILWEATWMDVNTTKVALAKSSSMLTVAAYPEDYVTNKSAIDEYYEENTILSTYFDTFLDFDVKARLRNLQDLNRTNYRMDPIKSPIDVTQINAYNAITKNIIVVPAGVLQPPFFDAATSPFLNYGAVGFVIGHEITHAFDDQGSNYDDEGNLRQWWNNDTRKSFDQKKEGIIDQYNNYTLPGIGQANGALTVGENIADCGGIKAAFRGFQRHRKRLLSRDVPIYGLQNFTDDQLFFLAAAQVWCSNDRPESLKVRLVTSVHSPNKFRANGAFSNLPEFSKAFSCSPGSQMNPVSKHSVW